MSGHSKFANIRAKKEKNDAAKGKIYTIIGREIAIAVKEGGPDPNNNYKLKFVIQKAKAAKVVLKEIRFGPQTDDHDYNFKLKHAMGFLKEGCKVKAYVFFKGRSILFKEQGEVLLLRFANDLEEYAKVDSMPVLEGKRMILMLSPKKPGK